MINTQLQAYRKAIPSSELMTQQYSELKNRYQKELHDLMTELQQVVQQQLVLVV